MRKIFLYSILAISIITLGYQKAFSISTTQPKIEQSNIKFTEKAKSDRDLKIERQKILFEINNEVYTLKRNISETKKLKISKKEKKSKIKEIENELNKQELRKERIENYYKTQLKNLNK